MPLLLVMNESDDTVNISRKLLWEKSGSKGPGDGANLFWQTAETFITFHTWQWGSEVIQQQSFCSESVLFGGIFFQVLLTWKDGLRAKRKSVTGQGGRSRHYNIFGRKHPQLSTTVLMMIKCLDSGMIWEDYCPHHTNPSHRSTVVKETREIFIYWPDSVWHYLLQPSLGSIVMVFSEITSLFPW